MIRCYYCRALLVNLADIQTMNLGRERIARCRDYDACAKRRVETAIRERLEGRA